MKGATIFVMYADGNGNVTISARDGGQGHVQPLEDTSLQGNVQLLEGSGIVNGQMVANIFCSSCPLDSSASDSSSPFIAAWQQGSALNSDSPSATITQHGSNDRTQFTFDLSSASVSANQNPFISDAATSTSSGASPSSTSESGGSGSNNNGASSSGSSSRVVGPSPKTLADYRKAHGIIMGVTVVLLFPIGATYMRLGGSAAGHGSWQILSLCSLIAGFGVGVELAKKRKELYNTTHTICGTVVVALFLIQPFLGIVHHLQYRKTGSRNIVSYTHIWYGRIIMILGITNGGLGLRLAANTKNGEIAYGVIAGVVAVVYTVLVVFKRKEKGASLVVGSAPRKRWGFGEKAGLRHTSDRSS